MLPQSASRSQYGPDDSNLDLAHTLEQHLQAGFPADLALDLVLNELVVRAAEATHANAAALALARGDEMVCRAATGRLAPDLGIPLNTRDGLSGACLQTRQPQLSVDTECDPRVDPAISRRLGIRSILIVPIFDAHNDFRFSGVLEVFSTSPSAFSPADQSVLEGFAEECSRIRQDAYDLSPHKPMADAGSLSEIALPASTEPPPSSPGISPPRITLWEPQDSVERELNEPEFLPEFPRPTTGSRYQVLTLVLESLTVLAIVAVSFLMGYRVGWLHPTETDSSIAQRVAANSAANPGANSAPISVLVEPKEPLATTKVNPGKSAAKSSPRAKSTPDAAPGDELVVYEKGKVIFRLKPGADKPDQAVDERAESDSIKAEASPIVQASSTTRIGTPGVATTKSATSSSIWLTPQQAGELLVSRTEPEYPPNARAARRSGNIVLEVHVAEDGSVSKILTVSGDPLLASAATSAVRKWRYRPYRQDDHPAQFQTVVTLSFTLPN